ncbi:MAG: M10 family metallopeptidase [Rhodobacteraceae bacterium]|nr:M10 family metallopeptidase [Paracoccaceae bacterium]
MAFSHSSARSVGRTGDSRIDGILSGYAWKNGTIYYSAPNSSLDYENRYAPNADADGDGRLAPWDGFSILSNSQIAVLQAALDTGYRGDLPGRVGFAVEGFTNLRLAYAGLGSGDAEIRVANTADTRGAYAYYPAAQGYGGDVWLGDVGARPVAGNYDYLGILHEVGHALGLKHPHEAENGFGRLDKAWDSPEFTVMSYRAHVGANPNSPYRGETWGEPQSYMMLDIAALQRLYGANYDVNSGNTTYSWQPDSGVTRVDGQDAIAPGKNRIFATIWDGGGRDTYDLSAYDDDLILDLRPGKHSVFSEAQLADLGGGPNDGHARGNIFNALMHGGDRHSLIERAIGGAGDDVIRGNQARNTLIGGDGDDRLSGADAADVLRGGRGADKLAGGAGGDILIGGWGSDVFRFTAPADSRPGAPDHIRAGDGASAFQGAGRPGGDRIDLSGIDANTLRSGNQAFRLDDSHDTGTIWLRNKGSATFVLGNTDRDDTAEFRIVIHDGDLKAGHYTADDFIL